MFRVIYGRVYGKEREAVADAKKISDLHPQIKQGKGSYVIELGQFKTRKQVDDAYFAYREQGFRVFIQNLGE